MSVKLIHDQEDITESVNLMEYTFADQGELLRSTVAFRPSRVGAEVIWNPDARLWSLFWREPPGGGNRYWICHGLANPRTTKVLRIAIETNVPHQGVNKRLGAAFVREETEKIALLHTGRLGGGSQNQKYKQRVLNEWLQEWERWWVSELGKETIFLGWIDDPSIIKRVARYADLILRARNLAK